jgi:tripartite-type tricarboxylate transporter receptor subunit TctC
VRSITLPPGVGDGTDVDFDPGRKRIILPSRIGSSQVKGLSPSHVSCLLILIGVSPATVSDPRSLCRLDRPRLTSVGLQIGKSRMISGLGEFADRRRDMGLSRRELLRMAVVSVPLFPHVALAEDYPVRPVRVVLGLSPGGSVDIVTRIVAQALSEFLGQQFIVEKKPGAAGDVATVAVVRATPDGYTVLVVLAANAINATLHQKLRFSPVRDLAMVAGMVRVPNVMEINPSVPVNTVPEFIAYAKANPGKLSYASGGTGSSLHVITELFKMMAGIDMVHVPYRGGAPALIDLLGGRVQVMFDTIPQAIDYIRDGKLRALAVTTATRSEALPNVPVLSDFVPGFQAGSWWGLAAPKDTPHEIIRVLSYATNAVLSDPRIKARLAELGTTPLLYGPAPFASFVEMETDKWARVLKFARAKED